MRRFFSFLLCCVILTTVWVSLFPVTVFAALEPCPKISTSNGEIQQTATDFGCIPNDPILFAGKFYGIILGFVGGIAVLFIVYGGYLILTSQGNPTQLQNGKSYIFYAIVGLLLSIFGYVIIQVVFVNILHLPGFS